MTAAVGLYQRLGLPEPWNATTTQTPLIVYGASGAVGAYAVKLAQLSNIHPIIAVAGRGQRFVEGLITPNKGDTFIDYRNGDEAVVSGIKAALKQAGASEVCNPEILRLSSAAWAPLLGNLVTEIVQVKYAFDAVSEKNSYQNISQVLAQEGSKITLVLYGEFKEIPEYIQKSTTRVGSVHIGISRDSTPGKAGITVGEKEFGFVFFRFFARGLQEGFFSAHPHEVIPGGLNGVEKGLANLKEGVNSATKYVFRIEDTKESNKI